MINWDLIIEYYLLFDACSLKNLAYNCEQVQSNDRIYIPQGTDERTMAHLTRAWIIFTGN